MDLNQRPRAYEAQSGNLTPSAVAPAGFEPASSGLKGRWHGPLAHGAW